MNQIVDRRSVSVPDRAASVRPGAAVDRVIDMIVAHLSSGELGPGEQLRQEDLAGTLGLSRVPVREALHVLAEQRVLVHWRHRGFFVPKRSPQELAQLARLIEVIEDEVLGEVRWPDDDTLARLRDLNQRLLAAADDHDTTETYAVNHEFHFTIFALSPLSVMIDELQQLWRRAQPDIVMGMITGDARRHRVEEHREIISSLVARDRERLVRAFHQHRRRALSRSEWPGGAAQARHAVIPPGQSADVSS